MWQQVFSFFSPPGWPGKGPQVDWDRNWPELITVVVAMRWVGRNAPTTIQLALLIAGFGVWWLGVVGGWSRLSRVWMALIGGWATVRLGPVVSSVWLPWTIAWMMAAAQFRRPRHVAAAALALALVLLSGDAGLTIATLLVLILFIGLAGFQWQGARTLPTFRLREGAMAGMIALLGLGAAAVQLVPLLVAPGAQMMQAVVVEPAVSLMVLLAFSGAGLWRAVRARACRLVLLPALLEGTALLWIAIGGRPSGVAAGLVAWGTVSGLMLGGTGLDVPTRWAVAHLRSPRRYVPAVARWAGAWSFLGWLLLVAALALADFGRASWSAIPAADATRFADLIVGPSFYAHLARQSLAFWLGAGLSALAMMGLGALVIVDRHRQPGELPASAKPDTTGLATPLPVSQKPTQSTIPAAETGGPILQAGTPGGRFMVPPGADPWQLPAWQAVFFLLLGATIGLILFLRLFKLEWLQSEIYGDIMIVRNYVAGVLAGRWPTRFDLSAGPLYHYLIAPIVALVGLDYIGLKVASVVISLIALAATYALCRELVDDYFALLTTFIAGVSSWLLVFSRLGNSQIISPLLVAAALWLVVRYVKFNRPQDLVACSVISALGLYVYPQLFVLPGVAFVTLLLLRWTGFAVSARALGIFGAVALVCAIPFVFIVRADLANFTVGYVGSKIRPEGGNLSLLLVNNSVKALLALHVRGDEIFRSNPPGLPHLDPLSGVLFLVGVLYWLTDRQRRRWMPLWLAPFVLLQVPSILAVNQPREVPSASRTLGITPIVYMLVASGLWWLIGEARRRIRRLLASVVMLAVLLAAILALNVERYFKEYLANLPYGDIPIGRLIANYADSLPADTQVYMVGCCWIYAIPDRFVDKEVARPQNWHYLEVNQLSCTQLQYLKQPAVLIWSFRDALPAPQLAACRHWLPAQLYTYREQPIFRAASLRLDLPPQQAAADGEMAVRKGLEATVLELDGQQIDLVYSRLDMGSPADMFDGNVATLARGLEANPFILEFVFPEPRPVAGLSADFAHMDLMLTAHLYGSGDSEGRVYTQEYRDHGGPNEPHIEMIFEDPPVAVQKLRLEILQLNPPLDVHIHVREIKLRWLQ